MFWLPIFPIGILGQVWYLIVSIPDLCTFTCFVNYPKLLKRFTVSAKCDVIQMAEVIASLNA